MKPSELAKFLPDIFTTLKWGLYVDEYHNAIVLRGHDGVSVRRVWLSYSNFTKFPEKTKRAIFLTIKSEEEIYNSPLAKALRE